MAGHHTASQKPQAQPADMVAFLLNPEAYGLAADVPVTHIETHISHVFLAGDKAYKLKKAVDFGFLNFTDLAKREYFCRREVALNRRTAPNLYLDVMPVTEQADGAFALAGAGNVVDWLVVMRRFGDDALMTRMLGRGGQAEPLLTDLADRLVTFHEQAENVPTAWGPDTFAAFARDNIDALDAHKGTLLPEPLLADLRRRTEQALDACRALMSRRQATHVKVCHGDLHLGNIAVIDGKAQPFDGIEFNDAFADTDTMADLAFLLMDLSLRGRDDLATLVLNRYLKHGDDFEGLRLLPLYLSYRAAIRAKIAGFMLAGADPHMAARIKTDVRRYTEAAAAFLTAPKTQRLIALGGLSGSGKSTLGRALSTELGAIHIRADAVRKHICGLPITAQAPDSAYTDAINKKTYEGMRTRAAHALATGRVVILDAVHGDEALREAVVELAAEAKVPFTGIWCVIPPAQAAQRIRARRGDMTSDATPHEKSLLLDTGRITWHRIETHQSRGHVLDRARDLLRLGD